MSGKAQPRFERRRHRRGIRRVAVVTVLAAFVAVTIVLAVGFATFKEFAAGNHLREDLLYSSSIRDNLQSIYEDLLQAESGTLGYVITGREEFLAPLARTRSVIADEIASLARLAVERPQHAVALKELARFAEEEMRLLRDMVASRNASGSISAASVMETRRGKSLMDEIRSTVSDISREEVAAIERRTYEVRVASQRTRQTVLLMLAAAIAVVAGSSLVIIAHLLGRRRAELALADTLARHRAILASAMDAIVTIGSSGRIETSNPATTRMFGWTQEELSERPVSDLFALAAEAEPGDALQLLEANAASGGHAAEFTGRRKDGSSFPIDVAVGQMRASDGNRLVAILHDVTERKRADIAKNEFVSTVSHELRTPLTSISGSLGLLDGGAAGPLPETAKRLVTIAHQNSRRLVRLINDILDIQKMQSSALTFAREPVSMADVAREAVEQNLGFAAQHDVRLNLVVTDLDTSLVGDHDRLIQVLTNLISNAVKFSAPESVVDVKVDRGEDTVRTSVQDHGTGIPPSFRSSMFTRFAQADNSDTRQRGGTGLGLAIVKEIVDHHNGRVSFETEEGVGTTFHVDLPARVPLRTSDATSAATALLVVDSDAIRAQAVARELEALGLGIDVAGTAAEAEGRAALRNYGVILLAPNLRDRDGIGLVRTLRRAERTRLTPLLLLGSPDADSIVSDGTRVLPIADWFDMPPDPQRLAALALRLGMGAPKPPMLHVCPAGDVRRRFAEAAREAATVFAAASSDDAEAALAMGACRFAVVDLSAGPMLESMVGTLAALSRRGVPVAGCSPQSRDRAVCLAFETVARSRGALFPAARDIIPPIFPVAPALPPKERPSS